MFFHDSTGDWLAEDITCSPKAATDAQLPCPQYRCFNAMCPEDGGAQESALVGKAEPVPLAALSAFLDPRRP